MYRDRANQTSGVPYCRKPFASSAIALHLQRSLNFPDVKTEQFLDLMPADYPAWQSKSGIASARKPQDGACDYKKFHWSRHTYPKCNTTAVLVLIQVHNLHRYVPSSIFIPARIVTTMAVQMRCSS